MESQPKGLEAELSEVLEVVVLPEMSGFHEQCIYRIRPSLRQVNPKAYTPQVVSIGPFHNPCSSGEENNPLKPMEEIKLRYFKGFLNRTQLCVADIIPKLKEKENKIRSCYAGPVNYNSNDFLKMIMIDACFIIEYFLRYYNLDDWKGKDPILSKNSLILDIKNDLILLENQLPFFVLKGLHKLTSINSESPSFLLITFFYFQDFNLQQINHVGVCPKHFTDLLRISLLPSSFDDLEQRETKNEIKNEYSASQLLEAGLVFKVSESKCLLDLKFDKGVLTMPSFLMDDRTEVRLRNVMAFEENHFPDSAYITQYMRILDDLINTEKDVSILVDKKIIVNLMGDTNSVVTMVNNLCKNILSPTLNSNYQDICGRLNGFYENPCNKYKAICIHEYFNTPVKIASTIAAVLLLFLTLIQTIFSVCSFFKEYKIM